MRVDLRILIFTPVLLGLGCRPENPYFVEATTDTNSSSAGETEGTSGTSTTSSTEDTSDTVTSGETSSTSGGCDLQEVQIPVDDTFLITSGEGNCMQPNDDGEHACQLLNFGGSAGARINNIDDNAMKERGAYAIRPLFSQLPKKVLDDPSRLQGLSLELVFYRGDAPATLEYSLAKIGPEDNWEPGVGVGVYGGGGATWEERKPGMEWSDPNNGPIGGSMWVCGETIEFKAMDEPYKRVTMCENKLAGLAQEWLGGEDSTRNGLVVYLSTGGVGVWIKSVENEEQEGTLKPKLTASICM